MQIWKVLFAFLVLFVVGMGFTVAGDGIRPTYNSSEKAYYLTAAQASFVRPGLKVEIQKVETDPLPNVSVTFRITDDQGQPLDRLGIQTPGAVALSFYFARIKPGDTQYTNYRTTIQSSVITGANTTVAAADAGGTYADLGNGVYRYTFGTKLPADFEVNATHTIGITADRDLTEFGLKLYLKNALFNFVPSGAPVTQVREVVSTAACNQCHDPLGAHHSGDRQEVGLCILCHQPQTTDADTLNTLDFKVFIHKLHRGANLPSVIAGNPYQIIRVSGGVNFVNDYSKVGWPQDVRNCTTCHQQASQADNWKKNPSRVACGSCHDDVDFATGKNHVGGVQVDDSKCSTCHPADGQEFDLSVAGTHTIPEFSKQLKGMNVEITSITNTGPGNKPTVTFTAKDNAGNPINISTGMDSLSLRLAGPTTDYTWNVSEDARTATPTATGYSYTFKDAANAIPSKAKGTYSVSAEFYKDAVALKGPLMGQSFTAEETGFNPIRYFSVDGSAVENRRLAVDVNAKCNVCHKRLAGHHGNRLDTSYCVTCHNPATTDNPDGSRTAGYKVPAGTAPTSINLRFMIHRIHTGKDLSRDYTVYRTRGVFNFNEVGFPGDRRNCAKCHVGDSYKLPMTASMATTKAPREFYSPLGPAASACLGCHDTEDAAAHSYLMTSPFGESCAVCHGESADFAVSKVHAH